MCRLYIEPNGQAAYNNYYTGKGDTGYIGEVFLTWRFLSFPDAKLTQNFLLTH
jgi:hypothetical protein